MKLSSNSKDDESNSTQRIVSLIAHIKTLQQQLNENKLKCQELEQQLDHTRKVTDIYKEAQIKYDRKCSEYATLKDDYDGVKVELLSAKQCTVSLQDRIQELQIQRDEAMVIQKQMERQQTEYQREIIALQQLRDTFDQQTFDQMREVEALQEQLTSIQRDKVEQDLDEINQYTNDIRRLRQKIQELSQENEELRRSRSISHSANNSSKSRLSPPISSDHDQQSQHQQHPLLYDRDSFDENDSDKDPSRSRSKTGSDHSNHSIHSVHSVHSGSNGTPPSGNIGIRYHLNGRSKTQYFTAEEMEMIANGSPRDDALNLNDSLSTNTTNTNYKWTESLWHDVEFEVMKMESLFAINYNGTKSSLSMYSPERPCIVDQNDEEKALEIVLSDDVHKLKLPQRLQWIYHEVVALQQRVDLDETQNTDMQTMIALKEIKIRTLQNKVAEIKSQKDSLKYDYSNLQRVFEGYRRKTKSYLKMYRQNVDAVHQAMRGKMDEIGDIGSVRSWQRQLRKWRYGIWMTVILCVLWIVYRTKYKLGFPVLEFVRSCLGI